jgi:hypothetical protein
VDVPDVDGHADRGGRGRQALPPGAQERQACQRSGSTTSATRTRLTSSPRERPSRTSRPSSATPGPPPPSRTTLTGSRRTTRAGSTGSPPAARRKRKSLAPKLGTKRGQRQRVFRK